MKIFRLSVLLVTAVVLFSSCTPAKGEWLTPDVAFGTAQEITFSFDSADYELLVKREESLTNITVLGEGTLAGAVIDVFGDQCVIKQNGLEIKSELGKLPGDTFYGVLHGVLNDLSGKKPAFAQREAGVYEYSGEFEKYIYTVLTDESGTVNRIVIM